MNYQTVTQSPEWNELKLIFKNEIIDKPLEIKTEGLSAERIAIEVLSSQIATKKVLKVISKIERLGNKIEVENKRYV